VSGAAAQALVDQHLHGADDRARHHLGQARPLGAAGEAFPQQPLEVARAALGPCPTLLADFIDVDDSHPRRGRLGDDQIEHRGEGGADLALPTLLAAVGVLHPAQPILIQLVDRRQEAVLLRVEEAVEVRAGGAGDFRQVLHPHLRIAALANRRDHRCEQPLALVALSRFPSARLGAGVKSLPAQLRAVSPRRVHGRSISNFV